MYNKEELIEKVRQAVSERRFNHCIGVMHEAEKLAKHWGYDVETASVAGVIHDICKEYELSQSISTSELLGVELDAVEKFEPKLIHAPLGAMYAKKILNIQNDDIYDAIKYHTTAKENMPLLTKIIYIADYIEPTRKISPETDVLKELAYTDINLAIKTGLELTISSLLKKGKMIHQNTVNGRNYLIKTQISQ